MENIGTDIRDIERAPQVFTPLNATLLSRQWYRWLYPLAILVTVLIILLIRLTAMRNADLTLVRNRKASRQAKSRLKHADRYRKSDALEKFYEEVGKALWGYLSDKLGIETFNLSRDAIDSELENRGIPGEMRREFLRILDESEFSRFAPTSEKADADTLYMEAAAIIRNLENKL